MTADQYPLIPMPGGPSVPPQAPPLVAIPYAPTTLTQLRKFLKPGDKLTATYYLWREVRQQPQTPVVLTISRVLRDTIEFAPAGHITAPGVEYGPDAAGRFVGTPVQVADCTYADFLPASHYAFTPLGFHVCNDRGLILAAYYYGDITGQTGEGQP